MPLGSISPRPPQHVTPDSDGGGGATMSYSKKSINIVTKNVGGAAVVTQGVAVLGGTKLYLIDAPSATFLLEIRFDQQGDWIPFYRGMVIGGNAFDSLALRWTGTGNGAGDNVSLFITTDSPNDRMTFD